MPAYIIAQVEVSDPQEYRKYQLAFMDASRSFGCKVLAATDNVEVIEGEWPKVRTVIMEYPSLEKARKWYQSEEYQKIAQHRFRAARTNMVLVDGFRVDNLNNEQ
jgi:uncharacterized protein (DUF1330 family)